MGLICGITLLHQLWLISVKAIKYEAKSFEITAGSLRRGYDYVASVRCNYTDYPAYWSEWSEEVEFHYDYQVTAEDILQMAVPVSCILIMAVSVICYFCFTKVKKEWWDQIPNPAKSHLVVENVKFSVLSYIGEIKFPFHDLKQSHMENQTSCENCLSQNLSSQNFKGKDNIRNVEKSCSCHIKSGEWFPKGSSPVLTPETIVVEDSIEICECLTDIEVESQEETGDHITMFEPVESSNSAFREHSEHNDALASMFMELLADENNMQDNNNTDIITGENETFAKLALENPSQQNPKESPAQSQQPCDVSHPVSFFTKAFQDDYNCSTASKKSELSEESFESGYQSSDINSASLDATDLQHMIHQSLFPCSSENLHDSCALFQESPNELSFVTKKDRISNPAPLSFNTLESPCMEMCSSAYKSFNTVISPSLEPCGSAYKSFDTLMSSSVEHCGSAYKSFDTLVSAFKEPNSSAYKSFDALMSESMGNSSLTLCFENECSLPQCSETPEFSCRDEMYRSASNQTCYTNYRSPSTELDFQNTCSEHTDFPSFSKDANSSASAFLPGEEIHKQVTYQNVQKKGNIISCPTGPQPSGYQPFHNAVKCNGTYCDKDCEVTSESLYDPFIHPLYNNLRETPPDTITCEPGQKTDDHVCLIVQGSDFSIVPDLASSENVTQTSDGSHWITNSNELSSDGKDESTSRDDLLELNYPDLNSRERTTKETKSNSFNCTGKGMQEKSSNSLNTNFDCHRHNHLRKLEGAEENKDMINHAVGRKCGSAPHLPEKSLDNIGLNLERKTAEPLEHLVSDKLSLHHFVDNFCPSESHIMHRKDSRPAAAVKKGLVESLKENSRKNEKKVKLVQALAQENNCYMKVA
ncbi:interleukin-4 receptor subunit alpha isoform X2 [Colius striatus]|uniref:interleukin-4 receptor subunit alpha isoform X2 n=1 Tax=Colius striatus TaxID=57412 RepID=UPI002B1E3848|nr:interleukin-4 receptor subunit alpha isoform X2 [Colius striatus]